MESIVNQINCFIEPLMNGFPNSLLLGLTTPVLRLKRVGDTEVQQIFPCVVSKSGECIEAIVDNTKPLIIYHKLLGMNIQLLASRSFGDSAGDVQSTHNMQMVVYFGRDHLPMTMEDLYIQINHYIPEQIEAYSPYKRIVIKQTGLNANVLQIFQAEYKNVPYRLRPNDVLFTINYTIETVINKNCVVPIC